MPAVRPEMIQVVKITRLTSMPELCEHTVVRHRAHDAARRGPREKHADHHDGDRSRHDRRNLRERQTDVADDVHLEGIDVVGPGLRPPDQQHRLTQDQRDADRRQKEAHEPGPSTAKRAPEHKIEGDREDGHCHREDSRGDHGQAECCVREEPRERAEGHHVAVRKVDEAEDPVDQRDADGGNRVHRSGHEAVHEELQEHVQITCGSGTVRPSWKRRLSRMASTVSSSPTTAPATMRPTAGAIMNPWPLKPAAT